MTGHPMLNIGCGSTHHPGWINLDVAPTDSGVMQLDIAKGLPFASGFADVCYSSHVLEHLERAAARNLVAECFRVLGRGGTIRLAVPDLESLAREYLRALEGVVTGDEARKIEYDWLMLELYDQTVRTRPGGEMGPFLSALAESDRAFVRGRVGAEAEKFWPPAQHPPEGVRRRTIGARPVVNAVRKRLAGWLVYLIAGNEAYRSYRMGLFRNSGEVHQWMYDRYSLKRLLEQAGFVDIRVCAANESRIPGFERYALDVVNGAVRKPDSLFMEASKA